MLIKTMTTTEALREVEQDFPTVLKSIDRIAQQYNRRRIKRKVPKEEYYHVVVELRSKHKNDWLIILGKHPSKIKYQGKHTMAFCMVAYYYTDHGLRAFNVNQGGEIYIYNGHLFGRYRERMGLQKSPTAKEVMLQFFTNNSFIFSEEEDNGSVVGICSHGLLLGTRMPGGIVVYKTFISYDQAGHAKTEKTKEILIEMRRQMEEDNMGIIDYKRLMPKGVDIGKYKIGENE